MRAQASFRIRRSADRWRRLSVLLNAMERCFGQNCKLDAQYVRGVNVGSEMSRSRIEQQINKLVRGLDQEQDRLTHEALAADLQRAQTHGRPLLRPQPDNLMHHTSQMAILQFMVGTDSQ